MIMARFDRNLPSVRGSFARQAPLKDLVWFRTGGPAEILYRPSDVDDLSAFLASKPLEVPLSVIGVGSNLLVRDGGIGGVVVRLPGALGQTAVDGCRIRVGAAALDAQVAKLAAERGIAGLEFLRGIPGTVGGALRMNAGCYGREIKDILVEATALDDQGRRHIVKAAEMGFAYRHCALPDDFIFVEAVFEGSKDTPEAVRKRMDDLLADRERSQPVRTRTGGSTFKNPPGHKAWQLIDEAGCRGMMRGEAQVSPLHCNFLINTATASAADVEALGEEVRARVLALSGIALEWEIKRVGTP